MLRFPSLACLLLVTSPGWCSAQQSPEELAAALTAQGFENLRVAKTEDGAGIAITCEDRSYRWEVVGLGVILGIASAHQEGRIEVTLLHTGVPMLTVSVQAAEYRDFLTGKIDARELFSQMTISNSAKAPKGALANPSFGKVDLLFAPGVRFMLVTPTPPGETAGAQIRAQPGAFVDLCPGVTAEGIYAIPITAGKALVKRAALSYNARLGGHGYFQAQAGRFEQDLDGVGAQASFESDSGRHLAGVAAVTASYPGNSHATSYQAFYTWRPAGFDAALTLSGGRYLAGDTGLSLDLANGFGESSVEVFATKTNMSKLIGLALVLPLGRQKEPAPAPVRLRYRNALRLRYVDERPPVGGGQTVLFADPFQVAIGRLNRAYLREYAGELRRAGRTYLPSAAAHETAGQTTPGRG